MEILTVDDSDEEEKVPEKPKERKKRVPNPDTVDWKTHPAKDIVWYDLEAGVVPLTEDEMPAAEVWDIYKQEEAFFDVPREQFMRNFKSARQSLQKRVDNSAADAWKLERDREFHKRREFNIRGEKVFERNT